MNFSENQHQIIQILGIKKRIHLEILAKSLNCEVSCLQQDLELLIQAQVPIHKQGEYYCMDFLWKPLNKRKIQLPFLDAIEFFDCIDSTNQYLKHSDFKNQKRICIAEMQTQGRGRFGRHWQSPFGLNLYLSLRHGMQENLTKLSGLSLVIGLAVTSALKDEAIKIKWPNDLWYEQQKLGGILIELIDLSPHYTEFVIGLGLNINGHPNPQNTSKYAWTSLEKIRGHQQNRQQILDDILTQLYPSLERFEQQGMQAFLPEWQTRDVLLGKYIEIIKGKEKFSGHAQGINTLGHLMIKDKKQQIQTFDGGEVTIKF